jgi:WD40 repeat protein
MRNKQRKAARVCNFLEHGPLPVKDLCGIIMEYSLHFEGERSMILNGHTRNVFALAALPDGKLASCSWDMTVRVWEDGACLLTLEGHTGQTTALAVLPDGKLASGSADRTVRVWDPATGACLLTLAGYTSWVFALAVMPDGKLASASDVFEIRGWDNSSRLLTLAHACGPYRMLGFPGCPV